MPYYDQIAKQWHKATGYKGGTFKELVLNDVLLKKLPDIKDRSILELGAGNGYFLPMVLRHFSGRIPSHIVVTDYSGEMLEIAMKHFRIPEAEYKAVDVRRRFPFEDHSFDLIIASMVFNEISNKDLKAAFQECRRVLTNRGVCLITVTHPDFIFNLQKRKLLTVSKEGILTMPGSGSLRLPVVVRTVDLYRKYLTEAGFQFEEESVSPTKGVLNVKSGLRNTGRVPIALVFKCNRL